MSEVKTIHSLEKIHKEFDHLLENLGKILKESRPQTNILSTKLGKLKKDLQNIYDLDSESLAMVAEIATKYISINKLFESQIAYNKNDLVKIIEGKSDYSQDRSERYNDSFFELSMATRFLGSQKIKEIKINLCGPCDVIINDSLAIECKYIHSISNMRNNIKKADSQIKQRVLDKQAKSGIIALDLSNVIPRSKIVRFAEDTFDVFLENYLTLKSKGRPVNPLQGTVSDTNFNKIISSFIMHEAETLVHGILREPYDMSQHTLAIIIQISNSLCFTNKSQIVPLYTRGMTYITNPSLSEQQVSDFRKFAHSLAVGV